MKRFFSFAICILLVCSLFAVPVAAAEYSGAEGTIVSQAVTNFADGSYFVETLYRSGIQLYSNTVSGGKTSTYYTSSGQAVYTIYLNGTFTYDGSSATATDAEASLGTHIESAIPNDVTAYTSGASAYATGSVTYLGVTVSRTVKLTCDKDGNLS